MKRAAICVVIALGLFLVGVHAVLGAEPDVVRAKQGMVVTVSEPASLAGLEILKRGGTAVDAAVATALALAVTFPEAGNIGGGGFMMIAGGAATSPVCVEYRETAPQAATATMFAPKASPLGHRTVGVPGTVRGLALAHSRYGKLTWKELVAPAIRLADEGFVVNERLAKSLDSLRANSPEFAELQRVFTPPQSDEWRAGDRLRQPDLAKTLRRLADEGPDVFYHGPIADRLVAEMQMGGGLITREDLASYQANVREPIHGTYRGYDIYSSPPPSSGGTCLVQMLNMLEPLELKKLGRWSPATVHLVLESMRRSYYERARFLGDPAFIKIPAELTTKDYAKRLTDSIDREKATPSESLAKEIPLAVEGNSTTHFSVIDADGMAVSNTYTLQQSFGSRVVVRGAGFLLNNEMTDFNPRPGHTDLEGLIGTRANQIAPGKRMLSSQTPTLVMRDGRVVLAVGSPGGRTIINTVLCVLLNVLEFDMDLRAAVDAPRLHHQWLPDVVKFEGVNDLQYQSLVESLRKLGHAVDAAGRRQGDVHAIHVHNGQYEGVADHRVSGFPAGY